MTTEYEQSKQRPYLMFTAGEGDEIFTFYFGHDPVDRMCELTLHRVYMEPRLLGSAIPLLPLEVGSRALLAIDTPSKEQEILEIPVVTQYGLAPSELYPHY